MFKCWMITFGSAWPYPRYVLILIIIVANTIIVIVNIIFFINILSIRVFVGTSTQLLWPLFKSWKTKNTKQSGKQSMGFLESFLFPWWKGVLGACFELIWPTLAHLEHPKKMHFFSAKRSFPVKFDHTESRQHNTCVYGDSIVWRAMVKHLPTISSCHHIFTSSYFHTVILSQVHPWKPMAKLARVWLWSDWS